MNKSQRNFIEHIRTLDEWDGVERRTQPAQATRIRYPDEFVAHVEGLCDVAPGSIEAEYRYSLAMVLEAVKSFAS